MIKSSQGLEGQRKLLRAMAEAGPGFRRTRHALSPEQKAALLEQWPSEGEDPPQYLLDDAEWIDRPAKLFEAGEYPDKGVTVTPEDLQALNEGFDAPVPVLIEHAESPLQLGFLTDLDPRGSELFGTIALTKEANALVEQSEARGLSLGLSPDLRTIREVSLVRNPRVETARLFSSVLFSGCLSDTEDEFGTPAHLPTSTPVHSHQPQLREWLREGRIVPAQVPFVQALLRCGDTIEFEGSRKPLRQLLVAMVERQPPHALFSELAPVSNEEAAENLLLPEEAAFYRRHFPDVSLREIASRR